MNKKILFLPSLLLLSLSSLTSCSNSPYSIRISTSEIPHAKILREVVKPIVEEKGYDLRVRVLDWALQNDALAHDEYDANYFQHTPFLNSYKGDIPLAIACKVHYEKLCMYSSDKDKNKVLDNGDTIEIVNDITNIERALKLLESNNILTINESNYDENNNFVHFDIIHPNNCVTFKPGYEKCKLTCIAESNLCISLGDYNFGIIPGNTALTGLGPDFRSRIVLSENVTDENISLLSNVIAVKKENLYSAKTKVLVDSLADQRVKTYIEETFGDSVIYTYKSML